MNITLGRLKVYDRMSEETVAYNADILLDGRKVGEASNTGKGEADRIYWSDREQGRAIEAYAKSLPPQQLGDMTIPMDIEGLLGSLVEDERLRKMCKRATLIRMDGSLFTLNTLDRPRVVAYMAVKYAGKPYAIENDRLAKAVTV